MWSLYGEDHELFRSSVQKFIERHIEPEFDNFVKERLIPREVWRAAGDLGLLGVDVPQKYGGTGAEDYRFNAIISKELAETSAGLASSFGIHYDVVAPYIVELAAESRREEWLPAFCRGELVTAIAMTEPSAGSDLAAIRTSAHFNGDVWVLNGSKTFVTNGYSADLVIVAAKTANGPGARSITLFAVPAEAEGFERGRKLDKIGQHEVDTAELFFNEVRLDSSSVLGDVNQGFIHMMERLPQERLGAAIANVAHAGKVLDDTIAYAKEREAFGRAIGTFQHNRFLLADLTTQIEVTRAYVDLCIEKHCHRQLSPVDAAKAKWWSADVQNRVIDSCVQLHGGYGYMQEYRVARAWTDARVTRIWAGSNEIMKEIIGRDLGL